jgi:hypothetical protein
MHSEMTESNQIIYYPKLLIVGVSFIPNTGVGITISNLFRNWPKANLAVANYITENCDNSICNNYYPLKFRNIKSDNSK